MNLLSETTHYKSRITYLHKRFLECPPPHCKLKVINIALEKINLNPSPMWVVWGINGSYAFYIFSKRKIPKEYIVDYHFTGRVVSKPDSNPNHPWWGPILGVRKPSPKSMGLIS